MDMLLRYRWKAVVQNWLVGVEVVLKELCKKVVGIRRVSRIVMVVVLIFEEDVLRLICRYAQLGDGSTRQKARLCA